MMVRPGNKLAEALRDGGIYNAHGLLLKFGQPGRDVAVDFISEFGRGSYAKTKVYSPSHKTNPKAHWTDHGCQTYSGTRRDTMPKALAWAEERYGVREWLPCPFGGASTRLPAEVVLAARRFVKPRGQRRPARTP